MSVPTHCTQRARTPRVTEELCGVAALREAALVPPWGTSSDVALNIFWYVPATAQL